MATLEPVNNFDQNTKLLAANALADAERRGIPSIRVTNGAVWQELVVPRVLHKLPNSCDAVGSSSKLMPIGSDCVYFLRPWYRLTLRFLRQLMTYDIAHLGLRVGGAWLLLPIPRRLIRSSYRRLRQLPSSFSVFTAGAPKIAAPRALGDANLQRLFDAMIRERAASYSAVPRRIVQVCGSLQPGGAERQVAYTLRCLAQSDIESVQLLCHFLTRGGVHSYDFHLPLIDTTVSAVREIHQRSRHPDLAALPPRIRDIARFLPQRVAVDISDLYLEFLELRPEIVHAWLDWDNVRAGLAAVLAGVPKVILSGRNINPTNFKLYKSYMDPAYRALVGAPNVNLINNSRAGADDYADWIGIPRDRIGVIHNAVDCKYSRPKGEAARALRISLGTDPNAFIIGGVFRFNEEKRPLLWIETAKIVAEHLPDAHFIIFGSGSMQHEIELKIRKSRLDKRVTLAGLTDHVLPAMSVMDALLLTSHGEGLPNVLLEAQAVGTPVVATAVGGVSEAIEDGVTGWALKAASSQDLADRLIWLRTHPEIRADIAKCAPLFAREKFGMERMTRELLEVYGLSAGQKPT